MHELALRIKAVSDAGQRPQAGHIVNALLDDIQVWRIMIEKEFRLLATSPETAIASVVDMPDRLVKRMILLQKRGREAFAIEGQQKLNPEDYQNFYRLLGSYRGL